MNAAKYVFLIIVTLSIIGCTSRNLDPQNSNEDYTATRSCDFSLSPITPPVRPLSEADSLLWDHIKYGSFQNIEGDIKRGGDVNSAPRGTPLIYYAMGKCCGPNQFNGYSLKNIELLIKYGANLEFSDLDQSWVMGTPLLGAVDRRNNVFSTQDVVTLLLKSGANPNRANVLGETPLMLASAGDDERVVRQLIDAGACVGAKTKDGSNALHFVAEGAVRDAEVARLLIDRGLKVTKNNFGVDPLCDATNQFKYEPQHIYTRPANPEPLIKLLVENGADVNERCSLPAANSNYDEVDTPLYQAAGWVKLDGIQALLEGGADLNIERRNSSGPETGTYLLLRRAVREGDLARWSNLIEKFGGDYGHRDKRGRTLLFTAASTGGDRDDREVAKFLIAKGVDVNATDDSGKSALFSAYTKEMLELLLEAGANVNLQDSAGDTPLHYSFLYEGCASKVLYQILIAHGADPNIKNKSGISPGQILREHCG